MSERQLVARLTDVVLEGAVPFEVDHRVQDGAGQQPVLPVLRVDALAGRVLDRDDLLGQRIQVVQDINGTAMGPHHEIIVPRMDLQIVYRNRWKVALQTSPLSAPVNRDKKSRFRSGKEEIVVLMVFD